MFFSYPLSVRNDRELPADYSGPAFIWDIDKTYLETHFSSWRGLLRIPLELAVDKRAIPGMPEVLRGLRRGPGPGVACAPLYFISASPAFLRPILEDKMLRDGVEFDGITLKDWVRTVLQLRPDRLFESVGFKMAALLQGRSTRPHAREYLFGDDYEKDAEIFWLYSRWLEGRMDEAIFRRALSDAGAPDSDLETILEFARRAGKAGGWVEKIYIRLEKGTSPEAFKKYGPIVVPVKSAHQLAEELFEAGMVDEATVEAARHEEPLPVSVPHRTRSERKKKSIKRKK
jgi:hypothetical protein